MGKMGPWEVFLLIKVDICRVLGCFPGRSRSVKVVFLIKVCKSCPKQRWHSQGRQADIEQKRLPSKASAVRRAAEAPKQIRRVIEIQLPSSIGDQFGMLSLEISLCPDPRFTSHMFL